LNCGPEFKFMLMLSARAPALTDGAAIHDSMGIYSNHLKRRQAFLDALQQFRTAVRGDLDT